VIADNPNPVGDEDQIDMLELGDEQTVKGIFKTDIALTRPLSHVRALPPETLMWRVVRFRSGSVRRSQSGPATPVRGGLES
jgi:hypothetical protein